MKKIPFSLEYKDKIESGEVKVVTGDNRDVRIVCWDGKSEFPILALINEEEDVACFYNKEGKGCNSKKTYPLDLYILVGDDALTEFEEAVRESMFYDVCYGPTNSDVRRQATRLLDLAEKQLENKFRTESFNEGYEKGRNEANAAWRKWYNEKMEEED